MAIQKEILTRQEKVMVDVVGETEKVPFIGRVGTLALGKPGDIMTRAYGPVVRALTITEDEAEFGKYYEGKGILVNPGDCAAIGPKFETVKTLKKGQVGSFLVSGACVVRCDQVAAIAAGMKVQDVVGYSAGADDVCEIEVNGFDADVDPSSAN